MIQGMTIKKYTYAKGFVHFINIVCDIGVGYNKYAKSISTNWNWASHFSVFSQHGAGSDVFCVE